jgi:hypothetical protein
MFIKKHGSDPNFDSAFIDTSLEYGEAENDFKRKHPYNRDEYLRKGDYFSVNSRTHGINEFLRKRSTGKYCSDSHKVMFHRKRLEGSSELSKSLTGRPET